MEGLKKRMEMLDTKCAELMGKLSDAQLLPMVRELNSIDRTRNPISIYYAIETLYAKYLYGFADALIEFEESNKQLIDSLINLKMNHKR